MSSLVRPGGTLVPPGDNDSSSFAQALQRTLLPFWRDRASLRCWLALLFVLGCFVVETRLTIWTSQTNADLTQAVLDKVNPAVASALCFMAVLLLVVGINKALIGWLRQFVLIEWRRWLTARLTAVWFARNRFYQLEREHLLDNPDQRIAEDGLLAAQHSVYMIWDLVGQVIQFISYGLVLWTLGGTLPLELGFARFKVPGALFWLVVVYQGFGAAVMIGLGRPLIWLTTARQRAEADFRFAMANLRMNAEQVALYRGAEAERIDLRRRFTTVIDNWHGLMAYVTRVTGFADLHDSLGGQLALWAGWYCYFVGRMNFGQTTMVGYMMLSLGNSLRAIIQWFQQGTLYNWAAAVRRLDAFMIALDRPLASGIALVEDGQDAASGGPALRTSGLCLERPDGVVLTRVADMRLSRGERWLVKGRSGVGKSTLMRALAGMWPYGSGEIARDPSLTSLFLPQRCYLPDGSLWDALCYPSPPGHFTQDECHAALDAVRLPALAGRLEERAVWQQRLSPGEQQRLAVARALLQAPDVLLLDEATSALDGENETHLYTLLTTRLPAAAIVSIAHRESVARFHHRQLVLRAEAAA